MQLLRTRKINLLFVGFATSLEFQLLSFSVALSQMARENVWGDFEILFW